MKKRLVMLGAVLAFLGQSIFAAGDYGMPDKIQDGNILHCFDWPVSDVKAALPQIAAAGFGAVQISPVQRPDVRTGYEWHALYRPYDLAFKTSSFCSRDDLTSLCSEAAKYGIKIIVDVVANHVDRSSGYHDTWWDSNGRVRWEGGINYGNRYSITHGQLGDYGDINSESAEVQARAKAYVEDLKSMGVQGIRWDAAKHIGLPSEGCNFWSTVTSVPGIWHYGEILDNPGPDASIIKEYANYMSFTDNQYSNSAARNNGGIPSSGGGQWANNYGFANKCIYWGESHDTYSNDEWSQNVDQSVIDRAYCAFACRKDAAALYFSRPNTKGFNSIKVGKGSTAFTSKHVTEVNKFRNLMVGRADYFSNNGNAVSITRQGGGAVIVMKSSGSVSITNGGGYCPAGTYTDRVSGGKFTVTSSTISGSVGTSGVAVLIADNISPNPDPDPDPDPDPSGSVTIKGDYNLCYSGSLNNVYYWGGGEAPAWPGVPMTTVTGSDGKTYKVFKVPAGTTGIIFNSKGDDDKTQDLTYTGSFVMNDYGATSTTVTFSDNPNPDPDPDPNPGTLTIKGDYNLCYSGSKNNVYYWGSAAPSWPGVPMTTVTGSDGRSYKVYKVPEGTTGIIFNSKGDDDKTQDLTYSGSYVMDDNGPTSTPVIFGNSSAVESLEAADYPVRIYASGGKLYVVAPKQCTISVTTLVGFTRTIAVDEGTNIITDLAPGFYVVDGKKVVL